MPQSNRAAPAVSHYPVEHQQLVRRGGGAALLQGHRDQAIVLS